MFLLRSSQVVQPLASVVGSPSARACNHRRIPEGDSIAHCYVCGHPLDGSCGSYRLCVWIYQVMEGPRASGTDPVITTKSEICVCSPGNTAECLEVALEMAQVEAQEWKEDTRDVMLGINPGSLRPLLMVKVLGPNSSEKTIDLSRYLDIGLLRPDSFSADGTPCYEPELADDPVDDFQSCQ